MNTGNMNLEKPSIGSLDWGYPLNDNFDKIDDHDHSGAPKGKRIEGISLASTNIGENKILQTDGIGGFRYVDTPSGGGGLGSKVYVVAEEGGNFTDIQSAINNCSDYDCILINPHSSGYWDITSSLVVEQNNRYLLKGYSCFNGTLLSSKSSIPIFNILQVSSFVLKDCELYGRDIVLDCSLGGINVFVIENCYIFGGLQKLWNLIKSSYFFDITIKNSFFYSFGGVILDFGVDTDPRNSLFILNSRLWVRDSENPLCIFNVPGPNGVLNVWFENSVLIVDSAPYFIDKKGEGTLNIYISNCGLIRTSDNTVPDLVNPNCEGTVNIYYMDL